MCRLQYWKLWVDIDGEKIWGNCNIYNEIFKTECAYCSHEDSHCAHIYVYNPNTYLIMY